MQKEIDLKTNIDKAITHGGYAHRDDFISACILFAKGVVSIDRRNPTQEELNDKSVLVFDVGREYDVEKLNFDHHQFPEDQVPTCALSLILKYFGLYESFTECFNWLKETEYLDVKGPFYLAKEMGCKGDDIRSLTSAVEDEVIQLFGKMNHVDNGMWIYKMMRSLGNSYINRANEFKEVYDYLDVSDEVKVITLDDDLNLHALFYPTTYRWNPFIAFDEHIRRLKGKGYNVVVSISKDERIDGFRLYRVNDNPHIDFNLISDKSELHFVLYNGFFAITKTLDFYSAVSHCVAAIKS